MSKLNNLVQFNSRLWTHNSVKKTLTVEISDLPSDYFVFEKIYDDASDIGLAIRNDKTGNVTHWFLTSTERDAENDIICWKLLPIVDGETYKYCPELHKYTMTIYND